MSTVDETAENHDEHDDHHDHGEFIAHHFDSPQQQYDSGKLGIWVFLVTEVLFFSGLFCAYTLYRYHHPEVFVDASQFLDKVLGGINTIVLLFSSLTMAWAVRASQLGQNKFAGKLILITMVCAAVFLGVKAVEYSHKWDLNIFVMSQYDYVKGFHPEPDTTSFCGSLGAKLGVSKYLIFLSIVPTIVFIGFAVAGGVLKGMGKNAAAGLMFGMTIMMAGYFLGAVGGQVYQNWHESRQASHSAAHDEAHATHDGEHSASAADLSKRGPDNKYPPKIGIFFSIYYCMTGLHAIHVIGGMAALSWLYYRCLKTHWREDYFGPVDYVGLYWHLVDLIWIYLFPLLYLIK